MSVVTYSHESNLDVEEFLDVLRSSELAERRPLNDRDRVARMLAGSNLIIAARDQAKKLIGVSRALTDFSYCTYLSDLAVDKAKQGNGIGRQLIVETRRAAGSECMCLLLSGPASVPFYKAIGMTKSDNAFLFRRER